MATQNNGRILAAEIVGTTVLMLGGPGVAIFSAQAVGVLGIALGFGAQSLIKDYFNGLFLLLEDQIHQGDSLGTGQLAFDHSMTCRSWGRLLSGMGPSAPHTTMSSMRAPWLPER